MVSAVVEYLLGTVLGLLVGTLGGFAGIGGAPFFVAGLTLMCGYEQHLAQGTTVAVMLGPMTLPGVYVMWDRCKVLKWHIVIGVVTYCGFSYLGASLSYQFNGNAMKQIFGVFIFLLGFRNLVIAIQAHLKKTDGNEDEEASPDVESKLGLDADNDDDRLSQRSEGDETFSAHIVGEMDRLRATPAAAAVPAAAPAVAAAKQKAEIVVSQEFLKEQTNVAGMLNKPNPADLAKLFGGKAVEVEDEAPPAPPPIPPTPPTPAVSRSTTATDFNPANAALDTTTEGVGEEEELIKNGLTVQQGEPVKRVSFVMNPTGLTYSKKGFFPFTLWTACIMGVLVGTIGGLFGIGAGVLMVPLMHNFFGVHKDDARAISLGILCPPVSLGGVIKYQQEGDIDWIMAGIQFVTYVVTNYWGAKMGKKANVALFNQVMGSMLAVLGIILIGFTLQDCDGLCF